MGFYKNDLHFVLFCDCNWLKSWIASDWFWIQNLKKLFSVECISENVQWSNNCNIQGEGEKHSITKSKTLPLFINYIMFYWHEIILLTCMFLSNETCLLITDTLNSWRNRSFLPFVFINYKLLTQSYYNYIACFAKQQQLQHVPI